MDSRTKRELIRDATRYIWHPFTQMQEWENETPVIIDKAKGVYLYDVHGNRYLDGFSSIWVNLHGHQKSGLDRAIRAQLKKVAHSTLLGLTNTSAIRLAKKLIAIAPPGLKKVFYSDNGSTAIEVALKIAFQYWQLKGKTQKTRFLSLINAYHGDTIGSVSVGGIDLFHRRFQPLLFQSFQVEAPYCYRCFLGKSYPECKIACLDEVEKTLKSHHEEIAAAVVEPLIQGAAGMIMWPEGYLSKIRKLCSDYDVLFIADEVLTGFGRTGKMFACNHEGVEPDLMAIAKGLTGGYLPLAATLVTQPIYDVFLGEYETFKTFYHGHSYTGNPLGCEAALANLEIFENEKTLQKLKPKIELLGKDLKNLSAQAHVGEIRQIGLIAAIELVRDKKTKETYSLSERRGLRVANEAKKRGMIIRPLGNIIALMPPLSVSRTVLKKMVSILSESIQAGTNN